MIGDDLKIEWQDAGREPRCQSDPRFPDGRDIDGGGGANPTCTTALPYPAKRCGTYLISCRRCGIKVGVTTAGRPDDPRSVRLPCRLPPSKP